MTTYLGWLASNMGFDIYSNYPVGYKHTMVETLKDAQNVRHGYLLFDEFWEWVHARTSQSKINKEMMAICLLNRKRGVSIIYNTQLPRTIDVILRDVTNYRYLPHMELHDDNRYYIHYTMRNLLGVEYPEMIVPMPIDEIGEMFNTFYEVKKLGKEKESFLEIGIETEKKCIDAINKMKNFKGALFPNSGKDSGFKGDIFIKTPNNDKYLGDVKSSYEGYVVICDPEHHCNIELNKFIKNAKTFNLKPILLFPKVNKNGNSLYFPSNWFVYQLNDNSYLLNNKSHIVSYPKLLTKSINLNKWFN